MVSTPIKVKTTNNKDQELEKMCSPFMFGLHVWCADGSRVMSSPPSWVWLIGECVSRLYRGTRRRDLAPLPKIALLTYLTFVSVRVCVCVGGCVRVCSGNSGVAGYGGPVVQLLSMFMFQKQWSDSCSFADPVLTVAFLSPSQCEESVSLHMQFVYKHQKRSYMDLRAMWGFCGGCFHADSVCLISSSITCSYTTHRFSPKSNYLQFIIKLFDPWFLSFQMLLSVKAKRD